MPETIGALLGGSWTFFTKNIKTIFLGAIIFGVLTGATQVLIQTSVTSSVNSNLGNTDKLMELTKRMEAGDSAALEEYLEEMENMAGDGEAVAQVMGGMLTSMLPGIGLAVIITLVITLISSAFYMAIAIEGHQSIGAALGRAAGLALPILGVWIWAGLQSLVWIPIIGIFLAFIIGPKLLFSTVILINEKKGVMESVKLSRQRSKGYWLKIVGNMIVVWICVVLVTLVAGIALSFVAALSPYIQVFTSAVVAQLTTAFWSIFLVRLATTVMQNPKSAPQAA